MRFHIQKNTAQYRSLTRHYFCFWMIEFDFLFWLKFNNTQPTINWFQFQCMCICLCLRMFAPLNVWILYLFSVFFSLHASQNDTIVRVCLLLQISINSTFSFTQMKCKKCHWYRYLDVFKNIVCVRDFVYDAMVFIFQSMLNICNSI